MPDGAYNRTGRAGQSSAERQAARAEEAFANTGEGARIVALEARLAALDALLNNLQGANGIDVKLPVISFDRAAAGVAVAAARNQGTPITIVVTMETEGALQARKVRILVEDLGPYSE